MQSNRVRHLLIALLAVLALGAVAAGTASAAPTWRASGVESGEKKVNINSDTSRLWVPSVATVVICKKDVGTGTIKNEEYEWEYESGKKVKVKGGVDKSEVTFEECSLWSTQVSAEKQIVQKELLAKCKVANIVAKTKSKLVYVPYSEGKTILDDFEPEVAGGAFTTVVISGEGCALVGSFEVKGTVLGKIPRNSAGNVPTEEGTMGNILFETNNEANIAESKPENVTQKYPKFELATRISAEDVLTFGGKASALESTEQVELTVLEPFGARS